MLNQVYGPPSGAIPTIGPNDRSDLGAHRFLTSSDVRFGPVPDPPARPPLNPSPVRPEAVERVKALLDRWISRTAEHLVLAMIKRGEPVTVVVSDADYQGYLATLEIMDDPEAQAA